MASTPLFCPVQDTLETSTSEAKTLTSAFGYNSLAAPDDFKAFHDDARKARFVPAYVQAKLQKGFIYCLVFYVCGTFIRHLTVSAPPKCSEFQYPQCEKAIEHYLDRGAGGRCRAFSLVKAEGDYFRYPYSSTDQATCPEQGCCGCPGQCSKCPPLLPECMTSQMVGTWRVVFDDASETEYTFDAHGHVEAKLPASSVPARWKIGPGLAIGKDLPGSPKWATIEEAMAECSRHGKSSCEAFSYNDNEMQMMHGRYYMFFRQHVKRVTAWHRGSLWKTYQLEQNDEQATHMRLAGALNETHDGAQYTSRVFRLDLHRAAPAHFADGSVDIMRVSANSDLSVARTVKANSGSKLEKRTTGVGVQVSSP